MTDVDLHAALQEFLDAQMGLIEVIGRIAATTEVRTGLGAEGHREAFVILAEAQARLRRVRVML